MAAVEVNYGTGRRKTSTARVFLERGSGNIVSASATIIDTTNGRCWMARSLLIVAFRSLGVASIGWRRPYQHDFAYLVQR